jgi:hypothetical protein
MDPNTALATMRDTTADIDARVEAATALRNWITSGGYEPRDLGYGPRGGSTAVRFLIIEECDEVVRSLGYATQLARAWGDEWTALTPEQQNAIANDYSFAPTSSRRDYRFNIGTGRLASYADTLLVQAELLR